MACREAPREVYDMEEEKWYGILWQFLWQRRRTAALLAAFAGIYAVVFYLYDMETEAVLYAGGLYCASPSFSTIMPTKRA